MGPLLQRVLIGALIAAAAGSAHGRDLDFGGQVRTRFEFRDPSPMGIRDNHTSMRVRTHISASLDHDTGVFIQLQDVRLWGEETSTLGDFRADNLDLHQGYFEVRSLGGSPFSVRAGRQAIALGDQRLVGAVDWAQQGRAFDGLRVTAALGSARADLLGIKLAEGTASGISHNAYLSGVYVHVAPHKKAALDLYVLYNRDREAGARTDQATMGLRWAGGGSPFSYRVEGSYQIGDRAGNDAEAYMLGAMLKASTAKDVTGIAFCYDYLSGDDDPTDGKTKVFDTLFATNHKYYGYADLFLDIPAHTGGQGLQDLAVRVSHVPREGLTLAADGHAFLLARKGSLGSRRLAEEIDLTLTCTYSPNVTVTVGLSYVSAHDALIAVGRLTKNLRFGYLMADVRF